MEAKGEKKWRRNLADFFELPREVMLNLPRLTVIGTMQCYLENHRGVIAYSTEQVRTAVNGGEIIICGDSLVIRYLANEEIAIEGQIRSISFEV